LKRSKRTAATGPPQLGSGMELWIDARSGSGKISCH
jgi:hypothetical protein